MKSIRKIYPQDQHPGTKAPPITDPVADKNVAAKTLTNVGGTKKNRAHAASSLNGMDSLAGIIIHEIRNPLTAISLANQSLNEEIQHGDLPVSLNPITTIISKNISRIECLLHELLYVSSDREFELKPTDICDVIEQSLKKADDRIFLKKIEVTKSLSQGILVHANPEKLSIAFLNIIVNSIEAVREHEGRIWVTVYRIRNEVRVVFKDNGAGMEPDIATHMFDKNFSGKTKGLGVGLSHVREILNKHEASTSVSSEPGTGTLIVLGFRTL